ncbi:MAG: oligosaccharide flippase family protein [Patescibacteria group bacterium]
MSKQVASTIIRQMRLILKKLTSSEGVRQSGITIIGNSLATGLSAIALILISRILGPEKFGEFSVGFAIVMIITRFNDAGLSSTIFKFAAEDNDKKAKLAVFSLTMKYRLMLSLIIAIVGVTTSSYLSRLLHLENSSLVLIAFIFGLSTAYYEQLLTSLQALHKFTQAVIVNALQAGFKLVSAVFFLLLNLSSVPIIFSLYVLAPLFPLFFSKKLLPDWVKLNLKQRYPKQKKLIIGMAKHSGIAFILAGLIEHIDILFVQHYLNSYETGLLGGTTRISMMFALIAYSLGNVLFPRVARYKTKEHLSKYIKKAGLISTMSLFGFLSFLPFSKFSIWLTIGPEYMPGSFVLNILVAASFLAIASIPFVALFYSYDSAWYFSISGVLQLAIVLIGNFIFVPIYGLKAAAWTRLITRFSLFLFTLITGLILYKQKYGFQKETT